MRKLALTILLAPIALSVSAQKTENKALFSGANFLTITPNARAGAMGGIGAATAPDAYSIYWNTAKSAFTETTTEASFSYNPWMREVADDINLSALALSRRIDNLQTVSAGFRYFSFGKIPFTDSEGVSLGEQKPYEMSIDLSYSRKLSEYLSAGVTLKYIRSQLGLGQVVSGIELSAANSVAADISVFYNRPFTLLGKNSVWRAGLTMANIGSKLKYGENSTEAYLPGDLRLGGSLESQLGARHSLLLALDVNSLMIPRYSNEGKPDKSGVGGYFSSFGDIQANTLFIGVGAEYWYAKTLAIRAGYHHGHKDSGKPSYFSSGVGIKYFNILADFSYIAATSSDSPLRNSLQFSVGLDLDFFKKK